MHCPEGMDGATYVELVTAASVALSRNLDARSTFLMAEFAQSVANQMITLAIFKETEEHRRAEARRKEQEALKKAEEARKAAKAAPQPGAKPPRPA